MSTGGESEVGSEEVEVKRVRWRYVKGGLRIVILLCAGCEVVSNCFAWDITASADMDTMAGAPNVQTS